jgi:hypothetical protein
MLCEFQSLGFNRPVSNKVKMQVVWDSKYRYKAFLHRSIQRFTLDSSHISEEAKSVELGEVLFIVVDKNHLFCDLELITDKSNQSSLVALPGDYRKCFDRLVVEIQESDDIRWDFHEVANDLIISFGRVTASDWVRLGDSSLWIGTDDLRLAQLYIRGVVIDDSSSKEEAWLNDIEKL